jgi:microcystin-dependent protein
MANFKASQDVSLKVDNGSVLQGLGVLPQAGFIMLFAGDVAPEGWIFCEGGFFLSSNYPKLSDAFGIQNITPHSSNITASSDIIGIPGTSENLISYTVSDSSGFALGDYVSVSGVTPSGLNTDIARIFEVRSGNRITLSYISPITLSWTSGGTITKVKAGSIPNLKGRYLVGTTDSNLIGTSIGSNAHTHSFNYSVSVANTGTTAHNSAAVASNWGNISTGHNHGWNYSFGTGTNSNSFSNVPINVTAGNQANVWNSTHGHSFGGGIGYNAATVNHSHAGNMGETTTTGNSHGHSLSVSNVSTESGSSLPSTIYLKYIIKVG